jgi:hypothetical protein
MLKHSRNSNCLPIATDLCDATVTNISKISGAFFVASESCANAERNKYLDVADDCF